MYTCNLCGLGFPAPEDQRSHMKLDWHRYNLKRRVAQLPPIDESTFNEKVAVLGGEGVQNEDESKPLTKKEIRRRQKEDLYEKKRQILEVAKQNMLKQLQNGNVESLATTAATEATEVATTQTPAEERDVQDDEEISEEQLAEKLMAAKLANQVHIEPTTCLFCAPKLKSNFDTVDDNITHMFKAHGFYVPEQKYIVDKEGLLQYLGEKIGLGNVCLACTYQGKNLEAVREHMKTKRHMRLPYEKEDEKLEVSQFYDFSSSYATENPQENAADEEQEGDWEDVSGESDDLDDDDLPPVNDSALLQHGHELMLPSGAVIGHRSMARYYRQNLAPERILLEGQGTVIAAETRHMLTVKDRHELAEKKRAWGREKKRDDVNDRRAAKFINNQPHFRDPLLQ